MNESVADHLSIRARYAAVVKDDLELIAKERERIRIDIAALQDQLRLLEDGEAWLVGLQTDLRPLPGEGTATEGVPAGLSAEAVPDGGVAGQEPALPAAAPAQAMQSGPPTLRDLVVEELRSRGRPCSAQDVATTLGRAHPGRRIKEPAMRNALEAMVSQERVQRVKRGSRVFYRVAGVNAAAKD
ncbi:hypothetical protein ACFVZT_12265 [Streptomyces sp. NPDC058321]|uniref:hypothetical protein n=1 Tax=Streptomyces sp. NPDC058321 TaxID=3346445 RepID=UPI0036E61A07